MFFSPLFYGIAGLCAVAWALVYFLGLMEFSQASQMSMMQGAGTDGGPNIHFVVFARHISLVNLMMIFAVSAMSMRLFTDERRNQTMTLLLTAPVTSTEIALGKLVAGVISAWALVAVSFLYPASLRVFAQFDWGPLLASYFGLLLISAAYVAVGMFASCLTESAVLSVVMALIFNVLLWFVGALADAQLASPWSDIFAQGNISVHFVNFIKGSISLSAVAMLTSLVILFSFLTQRVVESNRWR